MEMKIDENGEYYFESMDGQRFKNPVDAIEQNTFIGISKAREIADREMFEVIYKQFAKEK